MQVGSSVVCASDLHVGASCELIGRHVGSPCWSNNALWLLCGEQLICKQAKESGLETLRKG